MQILVLLSVTEPFCHKSAGLLAQICTWALDALLGKQVEGENTPSHFCQIQKL